MEGLRALTHIFGRFKCKPFVASALCASLVGCQSPQSHDVASVSSSSADFRSRVYAGVSFGQSRLNPETAGTDYRVESTSAVGTQLRLGYDLHRALAVELDTALLGSSALGQNNSGVEFSAATVSALIYGLGGVQKRSRREGLSAFARLGYGLLNTVSIIENFEFSGPVPVLGLGAEYGFANGVGIRTEITRFSSDVSHVGIGAIFRFGVSSDRVKTALIQPVAELVAAQRDDVPTLAQAKTVANQSPVSLLSNKITPVVGVGLTVLELSQTTETTTVREFPQTTQLGQGSLADRWRPEKRTDDSDSDGVLDASDACPATLSFVTVGSDGCGLFDQILHDVSFANGSRWLNPAARVQLNQVAATLLAFPESQIKITAHTDSEGQARRNLLLSSRRASVVSEYLRSRGVQQRQLKTTGVGDTQPIESNSTAAGRLKNRRIELLTLPDLDAGQFAVELPTIMPIVKKRLQAITHNIGHPRESDHSDTPKSEHSNTKVLARTSNIAKRTSPPKAANSSPEKPDREPALLSAEVVPLPVPGYYPGLDIAGIVEGVEFEIDSDALTDSGGAALEPIVKILLDNPKVAIAVMVHTDNLGDELENENLTVQRADAVLAYLIAAGIERERLQAEGYGELLPLAQNMTESDRARNRRVEIRILPSWPKPSD